RSRTHAFTRNGSSQSPTFATLGLAEANVPATASTARDGGRRTTAWVSPRVAMATSSIHQPPWPGISPAVALNRSCMVVGSTGGASGMDTPSHCNDLSEYVARTAHGPAP